MGKRKPATTRQVNFRFSEDLIARLEAVADTLDLDVSSLVRLVLAEHLSEYEKRADEVRRRRPPTSPESSQP